MVWSGFGRIKEDRKNLSFSKIFQSADLSSECMRALPYNFIKNVSKKDFSYKMVIKAQWGSSWKVEISKNTRFYYMEKSGWNQFVSDNALGENEYVTFTHKGLMCFNVNIYRQNGKEIILPRKPQTTTAPFSEIKKEHGESSYKEVKKEEETSESVGGVELEATQKKSEKSRTSKKKIESMKVKDGVPEFKLTIRNSYLKFLAIPRVFEEAHMPNESKMYTIHHSDGKGSWEVLCLVRESRKIFSSGWSKLAREYPLLIGDTCTFKLIKPNEFVIVSKKAI